MRVLIVSGTSSYMKGGVPAETRTLIRGLVEKGHVVALASDAPLNGTAAVHVRITVPAAAAMAFEIERALRNFEPDFVHVISMGSRGLFLLTPTLRGRAWALTIHSVPPYERKLCRWHGHEALHYAVRWFRFLPHRLAWCWLLRRLQLPRIIVHSPFVERIVTQYGYDLNRVSMIPLAFDATQSRGDIDTLSRSDEGPLLVTVGGLAHTKGQHDVIKALPALLKRHPRLRYQMIGEIRDESFVSALLRLARRLGVAGHVLITQNLSDGEKQAALRRADVYVQPSHEEGFCLAVAEAAAVVPRWVGTDTGAIAAMGRDDPGARVVAVRSPSAIAAAVGELLRTRLPDDHMETRAQRLSSRFSFADYLEAHLEVYGGRAPVKGKL